MKYWPAFSTSALVQLGSVHGVLHTLVNTRYKLSAFDLFLSTDMYTLGGNTFGAPCVFPFKLNGKWYAECIARSDDADSLWCATSSDFDKDQRFGYCPLKGNLFRKISRKAFSKIFILSHGQNLLRMWQWYWTASSVLASLVERCDMTWSACSAYSLLLQLRSGLTLPPNTGRCGEYCEGADWDWWKKEEKPEAWMRRKLGQMKGRKKCKGWGMWDMG